VEGRLIAGVDLFGHRDRFRSMAVVRFYDEVPRGSLARPLGANFRSMTETSR